jgi:hypothetical protein
MGNSPQLSAQTQQFDQGLAGLSPQSQGLAYASGIPTILNAISGNTAYEAPPYLSNNQPTTNSPIPITSNTSTDGNQMAPNAMSIAQGTGSTIPPPSWVSPPAASAVENQNVSLGGDLASSTIAASNSAGSQTQQPSSPWQQLSPFSNNSSQSQFSPFSHQFSWWGGGGNGSGMLGNTPPIH